MMTKSFKILRQGLRCFIAIVFASSFIFPATSFAYSGYGNGTSTDPYRIGSCSQLEEINNNLSGYYTLVANINCSGYSFTSLAESTAFSGTLDGQDHTIENLSINNYGLFDQTNGAIIENINIASGSVSGSGSIGSFVGTPNNTTLTNVHSSMTVSGTSESGGLAGYAEGTTVVSDSSFSGSMTGNGYTGGLIGVFDSANDVINDSFMSGSMTNDGVYSGSIVGGFWGGTINRVYTTANINMNGNIYDGGMVGNSQGTINNSFSAATITDPGADYGALGGDYFGTGSYNGNYFDQYLAGTANACAFNSSQCLSTAVDTSGNQLSYFKDNVTNGPFSTWDFNNVWQETSSYPTLLDLSLFNGQGGVPNNGDANGDGVLDSYQPNVLNLESNIGWVNISTSSSNGCTLGIGQSLGASAPADPGYTSLTHMLDFNAYCPSAGMTVPITLIFSRLIDTTGAKLLFYNPNTKSYSIVSGATFSTVTIGGNTETEVNYSLTNGGPYDLSGTASGLIEDPVLIATPPSVTAPNTGYGMPHNSDTMEAAIAGSSTIAIAASLFLVYRNMRRLRISGN